MNPTQSPNFCVMPWMNLATETNGKCKVCCAVMFNRYIKKDDGSDFHIHKDKIEEIFNSSYLKEVRAKMVRGEWPEDCHYCQNQELSGATSPRIEFTARWMDSDFARTISANLALASSDAQILPVSLEPRPGITCNLKCNTCWSISSSSILNERRAALAGQFGEMPKFLRDEWQNEVDEALRSDFNWSSHPTYLENLNACLPNLRRVYFTGGEPALIPSNRVLMRELLAKGRDDVLLSFTSNLTAIDDEFLDLCQRFKRLEITGSIDGFAQVNDYIRFPSRWEQVTNNIKKITDRGITFTIMTVVQIANIEGYVNLLRWLAHDSPYKQLRVLPTVLQFAPYLRFDILPLELRQEAMKTIDDALADSRILQENRDRLAFVREQLMNENPEANQLRGKFREYILFLDRVRKTDFRRTFPHLTSLVGT